MNFLPFAELDRWILRLHETNHRLQETRTVLLRCAMLKSRRVQWTWTNWMPLSWRSVPKIALIPKVKTITTPVRRRRRDERVHRRHLTRKGYRPAAAMFIRRVEGQVQVRIEGRLVIRAEGLLAPLPIQIAMVMTTDPRLFQCQIPCPMFPAMSMRPLETVISWPAAF